MDRKKEIIRIMMELSGSRSPYEVFCDWVKCSALAIQNSTCMICSDVYKQREKQYMEAVKPYKVEHFAEMLAYLAETLEDHMTDTLGEIYMESGCGNKNTGQFFTPYHVSLATAQTAMQDRLDELREEDRITLYEPSCGGGGMIIAAAQVLKENGINYQKKLKVTAQDLDWKAVYMCYVQLSLLGIDAVVVQGNTLAEPYTGKYPAERVFYTPKRMGILL